MGLRGLSEASRDAPGTVFMEHIMKGLLTSVLLGAGILTAGFGLSGAAIAAEAPAAQAQASAADDDIQPMKQAIPLSLRRIHRTLGAPNLYLLDCNPDDIYRKSHLPGSIHINAADWAERLPKDKKHAYLVFYCVNKLCQVSQELAVEALKLGYYNVYTMPDGIQGWIRQGYEFEGAYREDPSLSKSLAEKNITSIASPLDLKKNK